MDKSEERLALLIGNEGLEKLKNARVAVVGVGGVGSFAVEGLARSRIGHLLLMDHDTVEESNINRQLCARVNTVNQKKTEVLKSDIALINPEAEVISVPEFYDASKDDLLLDFRPDFILDCIDSIGSKKDLIRFATRHDIPIISSMGMARKRDMEQIHLTTLEKTTMDPVARILRQWARREKLNSDILVVSSTEKPMDIPEGMPLPSAVFVPGSAGLMMAGAVVKRLMKSKSEKNSD